MDILLERMIVLVHIYLAQIVKTTGIAIVFDQVLFVLNAAYYLYLFLHFHLVLR